MTKGNDLAHPTNIIDPERQFAPEYHTGLTKREHFAATQYIPWSQAAAQVEQNLGHQGTILEVAEYLADMKVIAADALINALNETK